MATGDHLSLLIETNGPGGFYTEIARTIVLGRASQELRDGFAAMREMQAATLANMTPGAFCGDIAAAHDDAMTARGLPPERRLYSHGQGYDMVERPLIRADEPVALAAGTCLAVHPGYETPTPVRGDLRQLHHRPGRPGRVPAPDGEEGVRGRVSRQPRRREVDAELEARNSNGLRFDGRSS